MARRRLLWQLFPSTLLIILFSLASVTWYTSASLRRFYYRQTSLDLKARADLVKDRFRQALMPLDSEGIQETARILGGVSGTRITVVLPNGTVVADSADNPRTMENHGNRPEIVQAIRGRTGESIRPSPTLKKRMMYVAVPIEGVGGPLGVLRTAVSVSSIDETLSGIYWRIALAGAVVVFVAALIALGISRRISRPLEEIRRGAERFARGEFDHRLPIPESWEIGEVAEAMNEMASELNDRMKTVVRQRNELDAVLSSMMEGVLAVDADGRVISLNETAARWTGIERETAPGRMLEEVSRNPELQRFVRETLESGNPMERELVDRSGGERHLQVNGTSLKDARGCGIGVVVVLNDVTRLRRLESLRKDFVANVSHELRTPVTSIKGFVETLQEGVVKDPEEAGRFLGIIRKQVDRLASIIEDLLTLSQVEQDAEKTGLPIEEERILELLESAVQICESKSRMKEINVHIQCPPTLLARVNAPLLEQAVINLVDNAIKYSEAGSPVELEAEKQQDEIVIRVRDRGPGIERTHLPRLFERFYRVDRARSRNLGGTGLGLAIVKHIVEAHGGSAFVESTLGKGSTFSIRIPQMGNR